ncbi:hypothetical protein [Thermaurantiacus sp.]
MSLLSAILPAIEGPGLLALGIRTLQARVWRDGIPAIEPAVHRVAGVAPPPQTLWDRRFTLFDAWAMVPFAAPPSTFAPE